MVSDTQTEIHNRLVGELLNGIVKPPMEAGGDTSDVLVLLESVVVGVMLWLARIDAADGRPPASDVYMDALAAGVKIRVAFLQAMPNGALS